MPSAVGTACAEPGCPEIVHGDRCPEHTKTLRQLQERGRESAHERGYDVQWRKLRRQVMREVGWRCERCQWRPRDTSKLHAHHVVPFTVDENLRLERTNVEVLCYRCHGRHERRMSENTPPRVTLVCGPPGSGKTTYVREHAGESDLVVDMDRIGRALSFTDGHGAPSDVLGVTLDVRDFLIRRLIQPARARRAWVILTAGSSEKREQVASRLEAETVVIATDAEECKRRLRRNGRENLPELERAVDDWWREYRARRGETVVDGGVDAG